MPGARARLRDALARDRVALKQSRDVLFLSAIALADLLEEARHAVRIEAGRGQHLHSDAVRLDLVRACEVDLMLLHEPLRARDDAG